MTKYYLSYNNPYKSTNSCLKSNINGKKIIIIVHLFSMTF